MGVNKLFQILVPKEKKFFPLFKELADALAKAADYLVEFIKETDPEKRQDIYKNIKCEEKNGDVVVYRIFKELNSSFITPFDREDIQYLASKLDDVLDYIHGAANRGVLYRPHSTSAYFIKMVELVHTAAYELKNAMYELENIKKKPKIFEEISLNVYKLEESADDVYAMFLRDLFENEKDAIELIKQKEIMSSLETATDKAEDVTDNLKAILVKLA
jgi:predicted phosphate transport protein (TIGR00153 family)